jgi:hypothetical protein
MKSSKYLYLLIALLMVAAAPALFAQTPKGTIIGTWTLKFENNAEGRIEVDSKIIKLDIPGCLKGEGNIGDRGDYFESLHVTDGKTDIFIWGKIKGGSVEGEIRVAAYDLQVMKTTIQSFESFWTPAFPGMRRGSLPV